MSADDPRYRGRVPSMLIEGQRPQHQRDEGYWPENGQGAYSEVLAGNFGVPQGPVLATAGGPGIGVIQQTFRTCQPRVLSLGVSAGGAVPAQAFPVDVLNAGFSASLSAGLVDFAGAPLNFAPAQFAHPYLACVLQYGSGSARQQCWIDWYQGSYNLPACEFVQVSALPWGLPWNALTGAPFQAVASCSPGQMQGAHVPTVTGVGDFVAATPRVFIPPANARAVEVSCVDPTVNTTVTISGAAAGTRNLSTGTMSPGWTPLEMDLGQNRITITSSADAQLRVQFFLQL